MIDKFLSELIYLFVVGDKFWDSIQFYSYVFLIYCVKVWKGYKELNSMVLGIRNRVNNRLQRTFEIFSSTSIYLTYRKSIKELVKFQETKLVAILLWNFGKMISKFNKHKQINPMEGHGIGPLPRRALDNNLSSTYLVQYRADCLAGIPVKVDIQISIPFPIKKLFASIIY